MLQHQGRRPSNPAQQLSDSSKAMAGKAEEAQAVADSGSIPVRKLVTTLLAISFGTILEWFDYSVGFMGLLNLGAAELLTWGGIPCTCL